MSNEKRLWIIEARDGAWGANGICKGEVVRCKDCKYGTITENSFMDEKVRCNNPNNPIGKWNEHEKWLMPTDWFCKDGKRKGAER